MALTHLADTSVLTRVRHADIYGRLANLLEAAALARADISDLELGFTARNAREWDQDMADLSVFELVETTADHLVRARQVQRALASRSQRGRKVPDLLIAAAAEQTGLVLLHYDTDFDLIAKVTHQPCEWIVPRGSID